MKSSAVSGFKKIFPKRKAASHKGDFGHLLILAGSRRMVGCAVLAAGAALKCGLGLLVLGFPKSLYGTYTKSLVEAMFLPLPETKKGALSRSSFSEILNFSETQDVIAIGPGLSREKETQALIRGLVLKMKKPMVLDADGLFAFSGKVPLLRKVKTPLIITPHAGEFKRLFGYDPGRTVAARKISAKKASSLSGAVIVLKGDHTVVAGPKDEMYVNTTGNPGLAKGGTGDVLFGIISSFLAQGVAPYQAACLGVFLHGLAADLAVRKIAKASLVASDVVYYLSAAIKKIEI